MIQNPKIGQRVCFSNNRTIANHGTIDYIYFLSWAGQFVNVRWDNGQLQYCLLSDLESLESDEERERLDHAMKFL